MIKLLQGDCLERMKEIPDGSVDMILTDPPYGTTQCKWDSIIPLEPMWEKLKRVIKPNGAIVMTASQPFTSVLTCSNLPMFRYDCHESVLVFYNRLPTYNPQMTAGHKRKTSKKKVVFSECYGKNISLPIYDSTERYPRSIQQFSSDKQKGNYHPTQKPVALMEYLINTYTNESETVLDFACGSGTTGVAAQNLNRSFIGIELDETYFNIAQKRIAG
jgi:DNA modification methylase